MSNAHLEFERWAYGEGRTAGLLDGHRQGFHEGWTAGFDTGIETGAVRVLVALERELERWLPGLFDDLLPLLPLPEASQPPAGGGVSG